MSGLVCPEVGSFIFCSDSCVSCRPGEYCSNPGGWYSETKTTLNGERTPYKNKLVWQLATACGIHWHSYKCSGHEVWRFLVASKELAGRSALEGDALLICQLL